MNLLASIFLNLKKILKKKNYIEKFDDQLKKKLSYEDKKNFILNNLKIKKNNPYFFLKLLANEILNLKYFSKFDLRKFYEIYNLFLKKNNLDSKDFEIINNGNFIGSIGNCLAVENLILANLMGLRKAKKIITIMNKSLKPRNKILFKYFSKHLKVVENSNQIKVSPITAKNIEIPIGIGLNFKKNETLYLSNAANFIYQNKTKNSPIPLLRLNKDDLKKGEEILSNLGVQNKSWYVTLHVREVGFRGETIENTNENFRNSNPERYVKSIKEITNQGGYVIRVGDPKMSPLPKIDGLIDYCHSTSRSEFADIFLASTSLFCLGTSSGFWTLSRMFGTPVLLTNTSDLNQFFALRENDLLVPRLVYNKEKKQFLKFSEMFSFPYCMLRSDLSYKKLNLETLENNEIDLLEATKEMLEICRRKKPNDTWRQNKIKEISQKVLFDQIKMTQIPYGRISENFLKVNETLIN